MRAPLAATILRTAFAALLLAHAAAGLDPSNAITQYGHTAWRVRDGYFAGSPSTITQTTDGFLWIGTDAGLIRFDGVRFVPFELPPGSRLPDERIISLLGARDGSLWIGTANGLARWDGSHLVEYAKVGRFGALVEDRQGAIWAGHTRALEKLPPLCRFESGRFQCFRFAEKARIRYVGALHVDPQGDLWIGGEAGICRWRPQTPSDPECHEIEALAPLVGRSSVFQIADEDGLRGGGTLWVSAGVPGVWQLAAGRWTSYPAPPAPRIDSAAILSDRGSGLWIGSFGEGIIRRVQGRTEHFTHADGLSGDSVAGIFEDHEGSVWVATASGLDRFRDVKLATLTAREGLPEDSAVAVTASRDGSVWVAERHGLSHLETSGISSYRTGQGLPGNGPTSLLEDSRGRLWVGVDNGLAWRENGRFIPFTMPDGTALGTVRSIVEDRDGDVWIASTNTGHAMVRIRGDRMVEELSLERIGGQQVSAMAAAPQGGVWIAVINRILRLAANGGIESFDSAPYAGSFIDGLLPDSHGLWVATTRGLGLFRIGRPNVVLDTRGGLPCEDVVSLVAGGDGSLWLKSACGLVQIPAGELDAWAEHPERHVRVRVLDVFDGVQTGASPFSPRAARSLDGRLWFAIEEGGLQVLDPKGLKENVIPPPVEILRAIADRRTYPTGSELRLPPLTRDVEIDYTALSLGVPEKVFFRYRLEGVDGGGWQDAGTRREAFYTNLSPGTYHFRVVARNNDGVWNQQGAALDIAILPAFYQTRGFVALCVAAFLGLAWSVYRWRVRQVRTSLARRFEERLAERTRIAQDLHDTLLQGFLSASMQLYAAVEELPPGEPARGRFERVQQLMRQMIEEGRSALRGLRSSEQSADNLETSLARIPGELGAGEGVDFRIVTEGRVRPLLPVVRDEIYRIAREALVNAFRHAGASTIEVEIEYAPRQLRVVVRDDGGGIDEGVLQSGRDGHWGLSGMRERAERIGGRFHAWSRAGAGTEIELAMPSALAFADARRSIFSWWTGRRRNHDLAAPEEPRIERERSRSEKNDGDSHQDNKDRGGHAAEDVGDGQRQE